MHRLALFALAGLPSAAAAQIAPTPQAAVDVVTRHWTPNTLVHLPDQDKPLPATGSWSVQRVEASETALPACQSGPVCVRVLYRIAGSTIVCSFIVGPPHKASDPPRIYDLNSDAATYMVQKESQRGDKPPKQTHSGNAENDHSPLPQHGGKVNFILQVNADGTSIAIGPIDGPEELRDRAIESVTGLRFTPTLLNGHPIAIRIHFSYVNEIN